MFCSLWDELSRTHADDDRCGLYFPLHYAVTAITHIVDMVSVSCILESALLAALSAALSAAAAAVLAATLRSAFAIRLAVTAAVVFLLFLFVGAMVKFQRIFSS